MTDTGQITAPHESGDELMVDAGMFDPVADPNLAVSPKVSALELSKYLRAQKRKASRPNMRGENAFAILCDYQTFLVDQEYDLSQDTGYILGGFKSRNHFRDTMTAHALYQARLHYQNVDPHFRATLKNVIAHPAHDFDLAYKWLKMSDQSLFEDKTFEYLGTTHADFFEEFKRAHLDAARQKIRLSSKLAESYDDNQLGYNLMDQVVKDHLPIVGTDDIEMHVAAYLESSAEEIDTLAATFTQRLFKEIMDDIAVPADLSENTIKRLAPEKDAKKTRPSSSTVVMHDAFEQARAKKLGIQTSKDPVVEEQQPDLIKFDSAKKDLVKKATAVKDHPYPYGSFEWHEKICEAMDLIRDNNNLEHDPETYADTQFTQAQFLVEFHKSVEAIMRNNITMSLLDETSIDEMKNLIEVFEEMREMFEDDIEMPEDADPNHAHEDFWFWQVLREYGLRSYTHLIENTQIKIAASMARGTIALVREAESDKDQEKPPVAMTAIADNLLDAELCFQEAHFPADHPLALATLDIDQAQMNRVLVRAAPFVANRDWSRSFHDGYSPNDHLEMLGRADRASEKIEGMLEERLLNFTQTQLLSQMRRANLRRIEYLLAHSCISLQGPGAKHIALRDAFKAMKEGKYDLTNPAIHEAMGMTASRAEYFQRQYEQVQLMDRWKYANDDENDPTQRLSNLKAVRAATERMDADQLKSFLKNAGADALDTMPGLIREVAIDLFNENMEQAGNNQDDPLYVHEMLRAAAESLKAIHPQILKNDLMFQRAVNSDRKEFLDSLEDASKQVKILITLKHSGTNWQPSAAIVVRAAMADHLNGESSYRAVEGLARKLHDEGRSILDPQLMRLTGLTPDSLSTFMNTQALRAAQVCVHEAVAKKGSPLSLSAMHEHAYVAWQKTLGWISLTSHSALSDEPWKAIGLAGRDDFVDRFRESLQSLVRDLEVAIDNGSALRKGPYQFIQFLKETIDGYNVLGNDTNEADREAMRRAIRDMGNAAVDELMKDKRPADLPDDPALAPEEAARRKALREARIQHGQLSRKYKLLASLMQFVNKVDSKTMTDEGEGEDNTESAAKHRKRVYAQRMNSEFYNLTAQRIELAMSHYDRCKNKPGRGAALAFGINKLYSVVGSDEKRESLSEAMMKFGFPSMDKFTYQAGGIRMRQLIRRIGVTTKYGKTALKNPQSYVAVLRDLDRIETLVQSSLISVNDRLDILTQMQLPPTWLTTVRRMASQYALPLVARAAQDPTLDPHSRWMMLHDCTVLDGFVGTEMRESLKIDWDKLDDLRRKTGQCIAAMPLVVDQIRNDWKRVADLTVNANTMLTRVKSNISDRVSLAEMGLQEAEIDALALLQPLLPAYLALKELREVIRQDLPIGNVHVAVQHFWEECTQHKVDPTEFAHMYGLGFESSDDFVVTIDANVLSILIDIHGKVKEGIKEANAEKIRDSFDAALQLMDLSGIEQRYTQDFLEKSDVILRADIEAAYDTVVSPEEIPASKRKAPAPKTPAP